MRVVLDMSPAVQAHGGMGRYAEELAKALLEVDERLDLRLFWTDQRGRRPAKPLDGLPARGLPLPNKPWRMSVLLATLARLPMDPLVGAGDLFHATDHLLPPLRSMRSAFTLHDIAFLTHPGTHLTLNRWFLKTMMPTFLRRASAVICVSKTTRGDAEQAYRLDRAKTYVIPEGVSAAFMPVTEAARLRAAKEKYGLPDDYILCVSTIEPRKNLANLLLAYQRLRESSAHAPHLVIAGRRGWKSGEFFEALERSPYRDQVHVTGQVAEADLPALYSAAKLFVYPSLYEGFGLPPLEAFACGAPVVSSTASSLREVVGDAALLADPMEPEEIAAAMHRLLDEEPLRQLQIAKGLRRAKLFSWQAVARDTCNVYREVMRQPSASRRWRPPIGATRATCIEK